eukprot:g4011.t1
MRVNDNRHTDKYLHTYNIHSKKMEETENESVTLPWSNFLGDTLEIEGEAQSKDILSDENNIDVPIISVDTDEKLQGNYVGLYFSGQWCPPSERFTPLLAKTYLNLKKKDVPFEIVFISSDQTKEDMYRYYKELHGPYPMLPFDNSEICRRVKTKFGIRSIPTLVVLDPEGNIVTKNARHAVTDDLEGNDFPWSDFDYENEDDEVSEFEKIQMSSVFRKAIEGGNASKWLRSRLMVVGEGRVGKTCLLRSLRGEVFKEQTSTKGTAIGACVLDKNDMHQWQKLEKDQEYHQMERAIAADTLNMQAPQEEQIKTEIEATTENTEAYKVGDYVKVGRPGKQTVWTGKILEVSDIKNTVSIHQRFVCDICRCHPMMGIRHHLREQNFDLCEICFNKVQNEMPDEIKEAFEDIEGTTVAERSLTYTIAFDDGEEKDKILHKYVKLHIPEEGDNEEVVASPIRKPKIPESNNSDQKPAKRRSSRKSMQYDKNIVRQMMDGNKCTNLVISTWDYGGQEVFYTLHHLFLTRYGVYLVVFNMENVLSANPDQCEASKKFLRFWLRSIYIHARVGNSTDSSIVGIAPIFLVGTRADIIKTPEEQQKVSSILKTEVIDALPGDIEMAIKQDISDLNFWPINNTHRLKEDDPSEEIIERLRDAIEKAVFHDPSRYATCEIPYTWLQVSDHYKRQAQLHVNYVSLEEFSKVAIEECGVSNEEEVGIMLDFFHQLGVFVHYNEPHTVSGTVILDPQWIIDVISTVICDYNIHGSTTTALKEIFQKYDTNHDGHIDIRELKEQLKAMNHDDLPHHDDEFIQTIISEFDTGDRNNEIEEEEWINGMLTHILNKRVENVKSIAGSHKIIKKASQAFKERISSLAKEAVGQMGHETEDEDMYSNDTIGSLKQELTKLRHDILEEESDETITKLKSKLIKKQKIYKLLKSGVDLKKHKKNQIRERWRLLTERGILDTALLPQLWGEFDRSQWGFLIALMSKFGLLCHLWEDNQYLVPSLLPEMPIAKRDSMDNENFRLSDLRFKFKILPSGFFERLQASAVRRSQQYKNGSNVMESFLSRHSITLTFGNFKCQIKEDRKQGHIYVFVSPPTEVDNNGGYIMFREEITGMIEDIDHDFFKGRLHPIAQFVIKDGNECVRDVNGINMNESNVWSKVEHWFSDDDMVTRGKAEENDNVQTRTKHKDNQQKKANEEVSSTDLYTYLSAKLPSGKDGSRIAIIFTNDGANSEFFNTLNATEKDGKRIEKLLSEKFGYEIIAHKINDECTVEAYENAIELVKQKFDDKDGGRSFIFYFAGHGTIRKKNRTKQGYCVFRNYSEKTRGTTGLHFRQIRNDAHEINANMQLWILDACHTGSLFNNTISLPETKSLDRYKEPNFISNHAGIYGISSCQSDQVALEDNSAGLFTDAFVRALENLSDNDVYSLNEEFNTIKETIIKECKKKHREMDPKLGRIIEDKDPSDEFGELDHDGEFLLLSRKFDLKKLLKEKDDLESQKKIVTDLIKTRRNAYLAFMAEIGDRVYTEEKNEKTDDDFMNEISGYRKDIKRLDEKIEQITVNIEKCGGKRPSSPKKKLEIARETDRQINPN